MKESKITKSKLFLELAGGVDEHGFSRKVSVDEFIGKYQPLAFGNGADWARSDGSLGKRYNIRRYKEGKGNKITHVELHGLNKTPKHRGISSKVRKYIKGKRCVVLGVSEVQPDHKDGRYDDSNVANINTQKTTDFQPLSPTVNMAKRQHCKKCKQTNKRFDAKQLGYPVSQIKGDGDYTGTCVGCYWHDPIAFNSAFELKRK